MNRYRSYIEPGFLALLLMLPAGAASLPASTAWAQAPVAFEGLPLDPTMDPLSDKYNQTQYKKLEVTKQQVLSERLPLDQTTNDMRRWYGLMFAQMTQVDRLDRLPALRQEFLKDLASTKSEPIHTFVLETVYRGMDLLRRESMTAGGKVYRLHPAVRFNAILLMGDLNAQERGIQKPQPAPYRPALGTMVTIFRDPKEPESSRMAALLGIMRHAKLDWSSNGPEKFTPAQRTGLINIMKAVVDQKTPPAGSSPEGVLWMRRRAIETLGVLGAVGDDPGVTTTLVSLVGDANSPSSLRCAAANALRYTPPQGKLEPVLASKRLGQLAAAICQNELTWIEKTKERDAQKKLNAAGGYSGMGGMGGMGGMEGYDPSGGMGMPGAPGMGMPAGPAGMGGAGMGMDAAGLSGPGMEGMMGPGGDAAGGYGAMMGGGMAGMGGMGGPGFKPLVPEDPRLNLARRRLKYQLLAVDNGLRGTLRAAGTGVNKTEVDKVTTQFKQIMAATDIKDGENPTLEVLAEQVRKAMSEMQILTAEPEAPAAVDEAEITGDPAGGIGPGPAPAAAAPAAAAPAAAAPAAAAPAAAAPAAAAPAGPGVAPPAGPAAPPTPPAQPPAAAPAAP
jgi:hypothetical protein